MRIRSQTDRIVLRGLARSRPDAPYMGEREDQIRLAWNRAMLMAREDIAGSPLLKNNPYLTKAGAVHAVDTHLEGRMQEFAYVAEIPMARVIEAGAKMVQDEEVPPVVVKARSGALRRVRSAFPVSSRKFPKAHTHAQLDHLHAAKKLTADLVVHVNKTQRQGIVDEIVRSVGEGKTVDNAGKRIATFVGLFPRWQRAVQNYHDRMVDAGVNPKIADKRAQMYSETLIKKRGMMIARTELMRALNVGRNLGWQNRAAAGEVDPDKTTKTWQAAKDACDLCKEMDGVEVTGLSAEFDTPMGKMSLPPGHPHCRCVVTYKPAPGDGVDRRVKTLGEGTVDDLADMDDLEVRRLLDNV